MKHPELYALLFWFGCAILVYTFAGYAVLIQVLGRILNRKPTKSIDKLSAVSVVVVAYNEESRICGRIENLLSSDYPAEKLEVIVVADGCTDQTVQRVGTYADNRVRLVVQPERLGKACGIIQGVKAATSELIVFADARQKFAVDAIRHLAANFADPKIGAVSGNHSMDPAASNIGGGVDLYWRIEKLVRHGEALVDSSVGCTGAIYAIRRSLFREIPPDTLLDDVVVPMLVAEQGKRVVFDCQACCFDPQASEPGREKLRKQRTLAGNFQMLFRYPHWLLPWKHRLWWQLISHKYLRIAAPCFLALVFVTNALLIADPIYRWLFAAQCAFYSLALLGALFSSLKFKLFSIPAGFCFLNLMTVAGFAKYLSGAYRGGRW